MSKGILQDLENDTGILGILWDVASVIFYPFYAIFLWLGPLLGIYY